MNHINDTQWQEMQELLEDDFSALIGQFITDAQIKMQQIQTAHAQNNNHTGLESAHSLKGAAANLGADSLAEHCFVLQEICHAGMIADAKNVINDIQKELDAVIQDIQQRLGLA